MSDAVTREETLLNAIATGEAVDIVPVTRKEKYLRYLAGIGEKPSKPITREEMFLDKIQAGGTGGSGGEEEASLLDSLIDRTITEVTTNATNVGRYAFAFCKNLPKITAPNLTTIDQYGFYASYIEIANFPKVTTVGKNGFAESSKLTTVDIPLIAQIETATFYCCKLLTKLILRNQTMVKLLSSASLASTAIASGTGYIYVPSALIEEYKAATNWSTYASQFRALEDYTVDGTITGELDESKI